MHVTSNRLQITVDGQDGTRAKVNIPPDELIVLGDENSYFICLSLVSYLSLTVYARVKFEFCLLLFKYINNTYAIFSMHLSGGWLR